MQTGTTWRRKARRGETSLSRLCELCAGARRQFAWAVRLACVFGSSSLLLAGGQLGPPDPVVQARPLSSWLEDLSTDRGRDQAKHDLALEAVREIGTNGLSLLLQRLQFKDPNDLSLTTARRAQARLAFEALGSQATPAIPRLMSLLRDETFVRGADTALVAAAALRAIGSNSIPPLATALARGANAERYGAALALSFFPASAKTVAPLLIEALKDFDTRVRARAAISLGAMPGEDEKVVPALAAALADSSSSVRSAAVASLRECGTAAKSAIPALVTVVIKDAEDANRLAAVQSLLVIGPAEAIARFTALLNQPQTFAPAARALGRFGGRAEPAIPALLRSFKNLDWESVAAANFTLRAIGPRALEALIRNLSDRDPQIQLRTIRAIGLFGAEARAAIPALSEAAKHPDIDVQEAALAALQELGAVPVPPP